MPSARHQTTLDAARRHLLRADPILAAHVRRVGPCLLPPPRPFDTFEALVAAVTHQQLNGKAAATILQRVKDRLGDGRRVDPARVAAARAPALAACGLSRAKALAVKDLAQRHRSGRLPTTAALRRMADDEIREVLVQVRGVGPWTVDMLLMFQLGRLDVLPVGDFGVRAGYSKLYGHAAPATPAQLVRAAEPWAPYRSVAAWYLWRVHDV